MAIYCVLSTMLNTEYEIEETKTSVLSTLKLSHLLQGAYRTTVNTGLIADKVPKINNS